MRPLLPQAGSMPLKNQRQTTHIMLPPEWWIMTYQGSICQIKVSDNYQDDVHSYRRNGWTSRTVAESTARKMNQLFHCEDFGVQQITGADRGRS